MERLCRVVWRVLSVVGITSFLLAVSLTAMPATADEAPPLRVLWLTAPGATGTAPLDWDRFYRVVGSTSNDGGRSTSGLYWDLLSYWSSASIPADGLPATAWRLANGMEPGNDVVYHCLTDDGRIGGQRRKGNIWVAGSTDPVTGEWRDRLSIPGSNSAVIKLDKNDNALGWSEQNGSFLYWVHFAAGNTVFFPVDERSSSIPRDMDRDGKICGAALDVDLGSRPLLAQIANGTVQDQSPFLAPFGPGAQGEFRAFERSLDDAPGAPARYGIGWVARARGPAQPAQFDLAQNTWAVWTLAGYNATFVAGAGWGKVAEATPVDQGTTARKFFFFANDGKVTDLQEMIPPDSGLTIQRISGMSHLGIFGVGTRKGDPAGQTRGFALLPPPLHILSISAGDTLRSGRGMAVTVRLSEPASDDMWITLEVDDPRVILFGDTGKSTFRAPKGGRLAADLLTAPAGLKQAITVRVTVTLRRGGPSGQLIDVAGVDVKVIP